MKYWHINTCSENNKNHMLKRNYCYIGLGGNHTEYNERILKNKHTTPHQFITFQNNAKEGDIILLYHNKQGYIAYGKFTGEINVPKLGKDLAPDWNSTEVQKHIQVKKWNLFNQPTNKQSRRRTLIEIKNEPEILFKSLF